MGEIQKYKISGLTTEDLLDIMENEAPPKLSKKVQAEFNEDVDFAKEEGYLPRKYNYFKDQSSL